MTPSADWRELHRSDERLDATAVVTSIRAMGFPGRIAAPRVRWHSDDAAPPEDAPGPYIVFVHEEHHADLTDVLPEIIEEQSSFNASIARREARIGRLQRGAIMLAAAAIGSLAVMGLIEL